MFDYLMWKVSGYVSSRNEHQYLHKVKSVPCHSLDKRPRNYIIYEHIKMSIKICSDIKRFVIILFIISNTYLDASPK